MPIPSAGFGETDAEVQKAQAEGRLSQAKLAELDRMMGLGAQLPVNSGSLQRFIHDQQQNVVKQFESVPPDAGHTLAIYQSAGVVAAPGQAMVGPQQFQDDAEDDVVSHIALSDMQKPVSRADEIRANAARQQGLAEARQAVSALEAQIDGEKADLSVELERLSQQRKGRCLQVLQTALGVDVSAEADLHKKNRKRGLASLVFCLVIIGIELDLLGFMCAFQHYWTLTTTCPRNPLSNGTTPLSNGTNATNGTTVESEGRCDIMILRILLICMPCAYMFCVLAYMHFVEPSGWIAEVPLQDDSMQVDFNIAPEYCPDSMMETGNRPGQIERTEDSKAKALQMRVKAPVQLTWIHFVPMLRFMLVIKSIDENDIEGVFRVNSLSSFTLGSAQIMGMLFTVMNYDGDFTEMNIFVYVNMLSQLINWTITLIYFATPVAKTMANSITVDAYTRNVEVRVEDELLQLVYAMEQTARTTAIKAFADETAVTDGGDQEGLRRRKAVEWEIKMMKNIFVPLDAFTPMEVMSIRRILLKHWGQEFANC